MEIKIVTNKNEWDGWLQNQSQCSFTQSFEWGEILKKEQKEVERIQFVENGNIIGASQLVKNKVFGFEYFFCPKGPIAKTEKEKMYLKLEEYAKEKGVIFVRIEPNDNKHLENSAKYLKSIDINPRATTILELRQTEEEILEKMHAKTRYNIRLAEKKGMTISNEKNFDNFWLLMNQTGERDGFRLHDKKHYEEILQSNLTRQVTALVENQAVAVIILVGFGDTLTYLFGASDYEQRQLMAPHLLQWEGIKFGKQFGYHYYDFFGIAPHKAGFSGVEYEYDEKHQYAGVTRFKLGFGGAIVEQPGTYDLNVLDGKYKMYEVLRKLRRLL